jgi:hypothetical protein
MKRIALTALIVLMALSGFSQMINKSKKVVVLKKVEVEQPKSAVVDFSSDRSQTNVVYGQIQENGDTLLMVMLPDLDIDLMQRYLQITDTRQGRRLAHNVKKVYPYAKLAGAKMQEYDSLLAQIPSAAERRRVMKKAEDEITEQYTQDLKDMTFSQGAILIRLIDRETSQTSYQVVQELRGKVRAFFYQGFARLWGYNLKTEYDPHNNPEDDDIETIMTLLERGVI